MRYNLVMLRNYFQKKLDEKVARGVIVIDKEAGITSHDEVDRLRRIFGTKKVGHSGTLDPKVTGVLVCGLGRGTKVLEYVLLSEKVYDCEIIFHKPVHRQDFGQVMKEFTGTINQLPPVRSRVKRIGRDREVYGLELLDFSNDGRSALIRCRVERGTYIRKLCHDMGQVLKNVDGQSIGAHMGDLRRIQAGPFRLDTSRAVKTNYLQKLSCLAAKSWGWWYLWQLGRYIEPIERVVADLPRVVVDGRLRGPIQSGADIFRPGVIGYGEIEVDDLVQVVDEHGRLLAVGIAAMNSREIKETQKGTVVEIQKRFV